MKKLTIISNTFFSLFNFRGDLIKKIIQKNHEVHIISNKISSNEEFYAEELRKLGCIIHEAIIPQSFSIKDIATFFNFLKIIKKIKPDYLLLYTIKPVIYGSIAGSFLKIKNVYSTMTGLGFLYISNSLFTKIIRSVVNLLYRQAFKFNQKVFFQNSDDLNYFLQKGVIEEEKTRLIKGSGVNLNKFKADPAWDNKKEKLTFLMVSRISKDKGVLEFLKAANAITKKHRNIEFLLVGRIDSNPSSLQAKDIDIYLTKSIRHIEFTDNIINLLSDCDVFVLPSYREGTPRSCLEAMALSKPIITTDVPGCREVVSHNYNGLLVEPRSSESLFNALETMLKSPELIERFGKNSLEMVQAFDVESVNQYFMEEIELI